MRIKMFAYEQHSLKKAQFFTAIEGCCIICMFAMLINKVCLQVTVEAVIGGSVVLPCSSAKDDHKFQDTDVHWRHNDSEIVYDIIKGQVSVVLQDRQYKNRVETFPDEYERRNFSIMLINLIHTDAGEFSCFITHSSDSNQETVQLIIKGVCCFIFVIALLINKAKHGLKIQDISVLWRDKDNVKIYDLIKGKASVEKQGPQYKNRAETFPHEYERGNCSIKLINLTQADEGDFSYFIIQSSYSKQEIVRLFINGVCCFIFVIALLINKAEHGLKIQDISVLWRDKDDVKIYDLIEGKASVEKQGPRYKDRAETFPDEYERGNCSIKLINLTHADEGDFSYFITRSSYSKQEIVRLFVNGV
ncbi:hypothetical protein H4Q32_031143 [Labeo rohita]|uniref:Ig-like domain-containing protein n=1 Tax=Labeo rohita TaxID=84645 RepID=A0ABQ8L0W8_LABRO|nr:hypothetical protein H4Q32_031143 [Labeo rohita]